MVKLFMCCQGVVIERWKTTGHYEPWRWTSTVLPL